MKEIRFRLGGVNGLATDPNGDFITTGFYGKFSFTRTDGEPDGTLTWTYTPGAGLDELDEGQEATDEIWVQVTDDEGLKSSVQHIQVTLRGTDDRPVITTARGEVRESGDAPPVVLDADARGMLHIDDPDIGDEARSLRIFVASSAEALRSMPVDSEGVALEGVEEIVLDGAICFRSGYFQQHAQFGFAGQ